MFSLAPLSIYPVLRALSALLLISLAGMTIPLQTASAQTTSSDPIQIRNGDRCLVCDIDYTYISRVVLHKGRRVALCSKHIETFLSNPQDYFPRLQPQGALFQEDAIPLPGAKGGWLWIGVWVFVGLLVAGSSAHIALRKGLPGFRWFFAGILTNLVGLICVWCKSSTQSVRLPGRLGKIPLTADPTPCPKCQNKNHPSATHCGSCGIQLEPSDEAEVKRAGLS